MFTDDGIYQFADNANQGRQKIHQFREFLYSNIPHRDHSILKVYTQGTNDLEMMALGSVSYKHHDGSSHETDWAGLYSLTKSQDGALKFQKVQIIINPAHKEERSGK
jgi:hypothetical protein